MDVRCAECSADATIADPSGEHAETPRGAHPVVTEVELPDGRVESATEMVADHEILWKCEDCGASNVVPLQPKEAK